MTSKAIANFQFPMHHGANLFRLTPPGGQHVGAPAFEYHLAKRVGFERSRMCTLEARLRLFERDGDLGHGTGRQPMPDPPAAASCEG
jgi:hypothetical protein